MFLAEVGNAGQKADGTGDGSQGIADLMSNGCREASHGGQAVLHADLPFQAADLGKIVESVNVSQGAFFRDRERGDLDAEGLAVAIGSDEAHFSVSPLGFDLGKRVEKKPVDGLAEQIVLWALQQLLGSGVYGGDVAVEAGG